jgi:hypothetical protein
MRVFLTLLAAVAAMFVYAATASATIIPSTPIPDCDAPAPAPCFVSITKNPDTTPVTLHTNGTLDIGVEVIGGQTYVLDGARYWTFSIQDQHGQFDLNTADTYEVVLDIGGKNPGETFSRGQNVEVSRDLTDPSHHLVTIKMNPVPVSYTFSGCNGDGTCPTRPDVEATGYYEVFVDNLGYLTSPADEAAMQGWDLVSSTDWISSPPTLNYDTHTFIIDAANAHCANLGPAPCVPFVGGVSMTFPFAMLSGLYDVDDPASLTPSAFTVSGTGSAASTDVTVDSAGHVVHVDISGMTFSKHHLKVIGNMRPGGVRNLRGIRVSGTVGKLKFDPAKPHGSKVRGYKATCRSSSGYVARAGSSGSPLRVTGLVLGVKYRCTVQAKSRFGLGARRGADMPAR